jgi:hypothetical protein
MNEQRSGNGMSCEMQHAFFKGCPEPLRVSMDLLASFLPFETYVYFVSLYGSSSPFHPFLFDQGASKFVVETVICD